MPAGNNSDSWPPPATPEAAASLVWVVRIGGLLATAFAAAISAQTLYRLGRLLGLPAATAWLLPGAVDLCAGVCIWTAARLPAGHRGRRAASVYATIALIITVCCNALFHAITLGQWTWQDDSLMVVSALPPIIVEMLLHLQTIVTGGHHAAVAVESPDVRDRDTAAIATANASPTLAIALPLADVRDRDREREPAASPASTPATASDDRDLENAIASADGRTTRVRWVEVATPVYRNLANAVGRRPQADELRDALAAETDRLITAGQLAPCYGEPSLSAAKRVRTWVEADHPALAPLHLVGTAA
jgi:hypothetical protein